jgi:hypothetical protein
MAGSVASSRLVGVTFVLELPVDLGPAIDGVQLRTVPTRAGQVRILVRRRDGDAPTPLRQTLAGLETFFSELMLQESDDLKLASRKRYASVAVVSVLHPTRAKHFVLREAWLTRRFDAALDALNRFLAALGYASRSPDVDAVRRTELPAWIPVILDDHVMETSTPRGVILTALQLHDFDDWRLARIDPAAVSTATWLFDHASRGDAPFRVFIEYAQHAYRELHEGLAHQAVLSACTAVEILVAVALSATWRAHGAHGAAVRRKLDAGFQNLLVDHLKPRVKAAGADPSVVDDWIADCYALRNQIAHEGFVPRHSAAAEACSTTMRLAVEVAEMLRHDGLQDLAKSLLLKRPTEKETGVSELMRQPANRD